MSASGQKRKCPCFEPMSASAPKDGVIGRPSLWIAEEFWVLRFRLMVKRGPWLRPQASEGEAQHGAFCWIGCIGQGDQRLYCRRHGPDRAGSEGSKRARRFAAVSAEPDLPLQADRTGSRSVIAMAFQRTCRSRLASDLC